MCPNICSTTDAITWKTFDPIFRLFTNIGTTITNLDAFQRFLFDTIIPYSTFFPLNINAYFNEVVYKVPAKLFDEKIAFFESSLLSKYDEKRADYTNPICVPNDIMTEIYEEWEAGKIIIEKENKLTLKETRRREKSTATLKSNATVKKPSFFKRMLHGTLRRKDKYTLAPEGPPIEEEAPESFHSARSSYSPEEDV
jgi:hypothetical protein